jgi:hypothetical protein
MNARPKGSIGADQKREEAKKRIAIEIEVSHAYTVMNRTSGCQGSIHHAPGLPYDRHSERTL